MTLRAAHGCGVAPRHSAAGASPHDCDARPAPRALALDRSDGAWIALREILSSLLDEGPGGGGARILCRSCGHPITSTRARIEVDGAHEHRKDNPAGLTFHIGCFRPAPGAKGWGGAYAEHAWFAGHTWRIALCAGCDGHLGWRFEGAGEAFHGLILDRLRAEGEEGRAA